MIKMTRSNKKETNTDKYPCFLEGATSGHIYLATSKTEGFNMTIGKMQHSCDYGNVNCYKPYHGKIELENV